MNDSNGPAQDPKMGLIAKVNDTLRDYFSTRREREELRIALRGESEVMIGKYAFKDEPLAVREAKLADELRELLIPNKLMLILNGRKSFATNYGTVTFKQKTSALSLVDKVGLEKQARKDGKLRTLGRFTRTWSPNKAADIAAWLLANPRYKERYRDFFSQIGGYDELLVKPNDPYVKEYDPKRLSVEGVNLGSAVSTADTDDQSPVA